MKFALNNKVASVNTPPTINIFANADYNNETFLFLLVTRPADVLGFNISQETWAIFAQYPTSQHTEASRESEVHVEVGVSQGTGGGGMRQQSSAVGSALPSAREIISTKVETGTYEDSEMSCDISPNMQMKVRVGVLQALTGSGVRLTGKLQLLDVKNISGNKVLVLRQPRLKGPVEYEPIDWPCSAEDVCNIQVATATAAPTNTAPTTVATTTAAPTKAAPTWWGLLRAPFHS